MTTRLEAAVFIRDAALIKIRAEGEFENLQNFDPMLSWDAPKELGYNMHMSLRSPFQKLPPQSPKLVKQRALSGLYQRRKVNLPWGLNIWTGRKALNIEWDEQTDQVDLVSFRRGDWENAVLSWTH